MTPTRKVYLRDYDKDWENLLMRFRLTYEGPLQASQGDPINGQRVFKKANLKQEIRKHFHPQLKELWRTNKFLQEAVLPPEDKRVSVPLGHNGGMIFGGGPAIPPRLDTLANEYKRNGYRYVPLARGEDLLTCSLDILFLRRDYPGSLIQAGDIDNRIKTLIDGLRIPHSSGELGDYKEPSEGEDPFFCLLEDDKNITALAVETDTLLDPKGAENDSVKLIITVELHPYYATTSNFGFL